MPIDIRASVTCSLGTLISATISDDYIQGSGLIKCKGSCEISGLITPPPGTVVTFSYTKDSVTRSVPRKLRVLSSFADPFRRSTKVELGCKLTYLQDLTDPLEWDAFDDPENAGIDASTAEIITLPIRASSAAAHCLVKLGLTASSLPLSNRFSIDKFDFSPGYVQVLSDLLLSESYCGYLDVNEVLQVFSLDQVGGTGPVLRSSKIIDLGPIGVGQLPGDAVVVSYSTLKLRNSSEDGTDVTDEVTDPSSWNGTSVRFPPFSNTQSSSRGRVIVPYGADQTRTYTTLTTTQEQSRFKEINERSVMDWRITTQTQSDVLVAGSLISQYLSAGLSWGTSTVTTTTTETFEYDAQGNQTRRVSESYGDALIAVGSVGLSLVFTDGDGNPDPVSLPSGNVRLSKEVEDVFTIGEYQKRVVHRYGNWAQSIQGQQAIAEGRDTFTTSGAVESFLASALDGEYLLDVQIDVQKSGAGAQQGASSATIINAQQADPETADPTLNYRTESTAEMELAVGSPTGQRRIELSMPYASDDRFVQSGVAPNYTYLAFSSDAPAKARRFGRAQNRLLLGNRNGMNVQTAPELLPSAPFAPVVIQANGLSALYRMNGTSWTMDGNGVVLSSDLLFWGAVGGTGDFWFPVAPGVVTLPTTPPEVDGEMTVDRVVPPWNETTLVEANLRAKVFALRLDYALSLETIADPYGVTVGMTAAKVLPVVTIGLAGAAPTVSTGASVAAPAATMALAGAAPAVAGGASVTAPAADVALAAISDIVAGRPRTQIAVPAATIAAAVGTPTVSIGAAVSAPANGIILLGAAPRLLDPATRTYVQAVEAADGQTLERGVVLAIDNFVLGCKSDGIWSAIKASCIMAGARTLAGALTPLVGTAPTNNNFVAGDYNRTTGLVGDGSTKYLDSSYAYPAGLQNNCHAAAFASVLGVSTHLGPAYVDNSNQGTQLHYTGSRCYSTTFYNSVDTTSAGLRGVSRSNSSTYTYRAGSNNETASAASVAVTFGNLFVHARNKPSGVDGFSNSRLAFYSIGESLDLALLDSRASQLIADIAAALA